MSTSIILNDQRFEMHPMKPFGVRLEPQKKGQLDLLKWTRRDLAAIMRFAREHLFFVVGKAKTRLEDWEHLPAPDEYYSARMWHFDGMGTYPVVAWAPVRGQRNPTAFVKRDDLVDAQQTMAHLLQPDLDGIDMTDPLVDHMNAVSRHLSMVSEEVRIQVVDRLYIELVRLARIDRLITRHQKSFWTQMLEVFREDTTAVEQERRMLRQEVMNVLLHFSQQVTALLFEREQIMVHDWNKYPRHGVFVYNASREGTEDSEYGPQAEIAHCRLDSREILNETELLRLRLDVDSAGNMHWAKKAVPAF